MQLEQARRVALFTLLILASVYAPAINAQRIKDLPKINKYDVYTDSLTILFDRHDSTKTTKTRYLKYGIYKWQNAKEFEPKYYRQNTTPSTSADSNSIWFDTNTNHLKYLDKKNSVWVLLDSLKRTHIDPTGVYTKKAAIEKLMIDTLKVGGQIEIVNNSQITGLNATKTYKQATDPSISNSLNIGDLWINTSSSYRFATYYWTGSSWTNYLPGIWDAPNGSGLLINSNYLGYYSSGAFQTYIRDNGYFYFGGDANNYISWLGDTLKIKGKILAINTEDFPKGATVYRQTTAPTTGLVAGDIWLDTNDGEKPYSWSGSAWIRTYTSISGGDIVTGSIEANKLIVGSLIGWTLETAGNDTARIRINGFNNRIEWVNNSNVVIGSLYPSGTNVVTLTGNIANQDTLTGGVVQTASSGTRAQLKGNGLTFHDGSGNNITLNASYIGSFVKLVSSGWLQAPNITATSAFSGSTYTIDNTSLGTSINLTDGGNYLAVDGIAVVTGTPWTSMGYLTSESDPVYASSTWYSTTNNSTNWNTAYGWGNHASAGYLTSIPSHNNSAHSETYLTSSTQSWRAGTITNVGTGLATSGTSIVLNYDNSTIKINAFGQAEVDGYNKSNWNTAYGWGDHSAEGYIVNPTNAAGFLTNDGSGTIGWGGSTYLQTWMDNNFDINDYTSGITAKSITFTIEDANADNWAFTFTNGLLTSLKKNGTEQ